MTQATTWGTPRPGDGATSAAVAQQRTDDSLDAILSSHQGAARPLYAVAGTIWRNSTSGLVYLYDGTTDFQVAVNAGAPASASDTGVAGQIAWDDTYFYFCTATDTWVRSAAFATW